MKKRRRRDDGKPGAGLGSSGRASKADSNSPALDRIPIPEMGYFVWSMSRSSSRMLLPAYKTWLVTSTTARPPPQFSPSIISSMKTLEDQRRSISKARAQSLSAVAPHSPTSAASSQATGTSVVMYTLCNTQAGESAVSIRRGGVLSSVFTQDTSWLVTGFGSGRIRVWSLNGQPMQRLRPISQLNKLDFDQPDTDVCMMYDENETPHTHRDLIGHHGGTYGLALSTDNRLIISGGADGTVRLWSTMVWGGALTVWRDQLMPVWCCDMAPVYGHYFVAGGASRSAHLYSVDHAPDALRVFCGHWSDVTAVRMHPNLNYVATGSADRAVRLFDVRNGKMVRVYTGHKGTVNTTLFSPCGRYLASGGWCGAVCLWDLGSGQLVGQLGGYSSAVGVETDKSHDSHWLTGPVTCLAYPPSTSSVLAAGGLEGAVRVWNTNSNKLSKQQSMPPSENESLGLVSLYRSSKHQLSDRSTSASESNAYYYSAQLGRQTSDACLQEAFFTRRTPVTALRYIDPGLLLAVGPYNQQGM